MKALNWIQSRQKWVYFTLVALIGALAIYLSIPFRAQFQYDYRLGQVWLEDDLYAPTDVVLPKSLEDLETDRSLLIENKDLLYDYHFRKDAWNEQSILDSTLTDQYKNWQETGVVESLPSENHRLFLSDGTILDFTSSLTPNAIQAKYGLEEEVVILPTYTLNTTLTDSALQYKLQALTLNKGILTSGTPVVLRGSTITAEKFEMLKALERRCVSQGIKLVSEGRSSALYTAYVFRFGSIPSYSLPPYNCPQLKPQLVPIYHCHCSCCHLVV